MIPTERSCGRKETQVSTAVNWNAVELAQVEDNDGLQWIVHLEVRVGTQKYSIGQLNVEEELNITQT